MRFDAIDRVPAFAPLAGMTAGILLWLCGLPAWVAAAAAAVAVTLAAMRRWRLAFALAFTAVGWTAAQLHDPAPPPPSAVDGREHSWSGRVDQLRLSERSLRLRLVIDSLDSRPVNPFLAELYSLPCASSLTKGSRVRGVCALQPASTAEADLPYQPDMRLYYMRHGVTASGYVRDESLTLMGRETSVGTFFHDLRDSLLSDLSATGLDDITFAMLAALLTGYADELPETLVESFRACGVSHALALSGFHVGVIALIVTAALIPLRISRRLRPLRLILSIAAIWGYAALTGFPESVTRAVIMCSIFILGRLTGRASDPFNSLCAALLLMMAARPLCIFSPGLQLSASAVLGIIAFGRALNPVAPRRHALHSAVAVAVTPLAAVLGTLPVTIAEFHAFPLLFLVPNIAVSLAMPALMIGGVALLVEHWLGLSTYWMARALEAAVHALQWLGARASGIDWGEIVGIYPPVWTLVALGAGIALFALALTRRTRGGMAAACAATAVACGALVLAPPEKTPAAILVRLPQATAVVMKDDRRIVVAHTATGRSTQAVSDRLTPMLAPLLDVWDIDTVVYTDRRRLGDAVAIAATVTAADTAARPRVRYLLVGSGFRGNAERLLAVQAADTVVISGELVSYRAAPLEAACRRASVPCINLRRQRPPRLL